MERSLKGMSLLIWLVLSRPIQAAPLRCLEAHLYPSVERQLNSKAKALGFEPSWKETASRDKFQLPFRAMGTADLHTFDPSKSNEPNEAGLEIEIDQPGLKSDLTIAPSVRTTGLQPRSILGEHLNLDGVGYEMVNFGIRQLESDFQAISDALLNIESNPPSQKVFLPIARPLHLAENMLLNYQIRASYLTVENYIRWKPYLNQQALYGLRENDVHHEANNDWLGVFKDLQGKSILELTQQEFDENLIASLRLARSGYGPGHMGDLQALKALRTPGTLPCLSRARTEQDREALRLFIATWERQGLVVGELTRFSRRQKAPKAITRHLMKSMLEFGRTKRDQGKVDIFILEVDAETREIFDPDYKFKELVRLSNSNEEMPEYVLYLDTRDPLFDQVMRELDEKTSLLQHRANTSWPSPDRWIQWPFHWPK